MEGGTEDDVLKSRNVSLKPLKATAFVLAPGSRHVAIGFEVCRHQLFSSPFHIFFPLLIINLHLVGSDLFVRPHYEEVYTDARQRSHQCRPKSRSHG